MRTGESLNCPVFVDPNRRVATCTYNLDGSIGSVAYTNTQVQTSGVSWTCDAAYPRVATMPDGTGTNVYSYHPVRIFGAGQLAIGLAIDAVQGIVPERHRHSANGSCEQTAKLVVRVGRTVIGPWSLDGPL